MPTACAVECERTNNKTNMRVFTNARIISASQNNGKDEEGKAFTWFTVFLKNDEGEVLEVSSGNNNFEEFEGESGVVELEIRKQDQKTKVKMLSFKAEEDEEEIT